MFNISGSNECYGNPPKLVTYSDKDGLHSLAGRPPVEKPEIETCSLHPEWPETLRRRQIFGRTFSPLESFKGIFNCECVKVGNSADPDRYVIRTPDNILLSYMKSCPVCQGTGKVNQ